MFVYALRTPMGGDLGDLGDLATVTLSIPDVKAGDKIPLGDGRRLLVLDVVPFVEEGARMRALLEVEELPAPAR